MEVVLWKKEGVANYLMDLLEPIPEALYKSMGFNDKDFSKPLTGIVNSWAESNPGHYHLRN